MVTPIISINFNRPDLTELACQRLSTFGERKFYLVSDGPRAGNFQDIERVSRVREILSAAKLPGEKVFTFRDFNYGLKANILSTLDYVFSLENSAIILEDDCLVETSFVYFCDKALEIYSENPDVSLISAHNPMPFPLDSNVRWDVVPRIWGWATWSKEWKHFRESEVLDLSNSTLRQAILRNIPSLTARWQYGQILKPKFGVRNWSLAFSARVILERKYSLSPNVNAVSNVGFHRDPSNSHDFAYLEVPKTREVGDNVVFTAPEVSILRARIEDLRRLFRWGIAVVKYPNLALKKILSILGVGHVG